MYHNEGKKQQKLLCVIILHFFKETFSNFPAIFWLPDLIAEESQNIYNTLTSEIPDLVLGNLNIWGKLSEPEPILSSVKLLVRSQWTYPLSQAGPYIPIRFILSYRYCFQLLLISKKGYGCKLRDYTILH